MSVALIDSFDVLYFGLYLINVFVKSTIAKRCTDFMYISWHFIIYLLQFKIYIYNEDIDMKT